MSNLEFDWTFLITQVLLGNGAGVTPWQVSNDLGELFRSRWRAVQPTAGVASCRNSARRLQLHCRCTRPTSGVQSQQTARHFRAVHFLIERGANVAENRRKVTKPFKFSAFSYVSLMEGMKWKTNYQLLRTDSSLLRCHLRARLFQENSRAIKACYDQSRWQPTIDGLLWQSFSKTRGRIIFHLLYLRQLIAYAPCYHTAIFLSTFR